MKLKRVFFVIAVLTASSCGGGGGGDSTPSVFDGTWTGTLTGFDCGGMSVQRAFRHEVDAESDNSGSVRLVDDLGNLYRGEIVLTANTVGSFWGFFCESEDRPKAALTYDISKSPKGDAYVSEVITVARGDAEFVAGCQYTLEGIGTNSGE